MDPDGKSGVVTIDKQNNTITVESRLVFFGGAASTSTSAMIAGGIAQQWNAANGKVTIDGQEYNVKFKITYMTADEETAKYAGEDDNTTTH